MCVYVDFLLKMYKIRTFNSDDDGDADTAAAVASATTLQTAVCIKLNGVGFKFRHADLISPVFISLSFYLYLFACIGPCDLILAMRKQKKIVKMELCLRLCNAIVRSLNNVSFSIFLS